MDAGLHEISDRKAIRAFIGLEVVEGSGRVEVGHGGQGLPAIFSKFWADKYVLCLHAPNRPDHTDTSAAASHG